MPPHPDCIEAARITGHTPFLALGDPDNPGYNPAYLPLCGQIARGEPIANTSPAPLRTIEMAEAVNRPGFFSRVVTFAGAAIDHAAGGFACVSQAEYDARLATCEPCEYRRNRECTVCTCAIGVKAWSRALDCPKGFWPKLDEG